MAWERAKERSLKFTLFFYLVPMMAIVGFSEWFGLIKWGRWQPDIMRVKYFAWDEAATSEIVQMFLMTLIIFICAYFIKALGETFHGRHTYKQTLTVVIYALSPIFLFRLLDLIPTITLWVPWALGILFVWKIIYSGVPLVMEPDPPHTFGLFFMSAFLITAVTGVERFVAVGYLTGKFRPFAEAVHQIAHKLHLQ